MYRVTITYGHPTAPAEFDEYYTTTHLPLAGKIPGVQRFAGGKCESLDGTEPAAYFLAQIYFASKDDAIAVSLHRKGGMQLQILSTSPAAAPRSTSATRTSSSPEHFTPSCGGPISGPPPSKGSKRAQLH